jgi:hypothetical protein
MMRSLFTPPEFPAPDDLEVCTEVCGALDEWANEPDSAGALAYLAARQFGKKWYTTIMNIPVDSECRERLDRALDALVRLDAAFVGENGQLWDVATIAQNGGKIETRTDRETGEVYRVLMFPYVDHSGAYLFQVARARE